MREKRHRIPPQKTERAKELRRESTFPERLLWSRLWGKRLAGLKFGRQHVVGAYFVDFYCAEAQLVIELDGRSHDGRAAYDRQRTEFLQREGLRVIRYSNDDVLEDVDAVAEAIARHAGWSEGGKTLPQPHPEREGGNV
jgi:very-short-patch-repair endonuclease